MKHQIKKILTSITGYWIYKRKHLPVGTDLFVDLANLGSSSFTVIFDVGANIGQTAKKYSINFPKAKVYSFEPISASFYALKDNIATLNNVQSFNIALGSKKEMVEVILNSNPVSTCNSLNPSLRSENPSAEKEMVQVETLDDFIKNHKINSIDLLKIDTEGWELEVLKGAKKCISENRIKLILCEVGFTDRNNRNTPFHELNKFMNSYNYWFYGLYETSLIQLKTGKHYGNALFISQSAIKEMNKA